ncbi:C-X-C motif chemokine 9 [Ochotona curzoniae]|uniref:C-X-C motif chemokine 9 n=1 Tax=Ochotona curzoniae TaxID=130825 RepID=UPI001B34AC29|nr:C-X-C motif chemokine 9 [Ochotona curzoniae]
MKKSCVLFVLGITLLILIGVEGIGIIKNRRCFCINTSQEKIYLQSLKDLKQFSPSPYCMKTEIIAIKKNGEQTCLNPDSTDVKELVKKWKKQVGEKKELRTAKKATDVPFITKSLRIE